MKHIAYLKINGETSAIVGDKFFISQLWIIVKDQIKKHNKEEEE